MDSVKNNFNISGFYKEKILQIIDEVFEGNAALMLREADLSHNYINSLKSKDDPDPSIRSLNKIINASKERNEFFNPLWLIRDEGEMFESDVSKVTEESSTYGSFQTALSLIEKIERQTDAIKDIPLPQDLELRLARLLVRLLERRK